MSSENLTLFRLNESGIYICLICQQNIFANLELEPHALEEHLLTVHDLTLQQDEIQDDSEQDNEAQDNFLKLPNNDIEIIDEEEDFNDPDYNIESPSKRRKHFKNGHMPETNSAIMKFFEHLEGAKYQCKKCFKVLRQSKGSSLQTHLLQQHVKQYKQILTQDKQESNRNEEAAATVDSSTVLAWMGHIRQRRRVYDIHIKSLQKQLDEKYDLYKQIGKDIDHLNEELDQYRITWLKEQKRIETITNFIVSNKNDDIQSSEKTKCEGNDDKINFNKLLNSKSANYDDEDLEDIISDDHLSEPPTKKSKTLDNTKPIFKVCFAERK